MKFSYNWIREFVPGLTQAALPLERLITMKTAECEGIEETGRALAGASVAAVLSVSPLPDTHNVKAVVDLGELGLRTVVCGAPNCRGGMLSVWLPVGRKMIHGVDSDGMLASGDELGVSRDHSGILELTGGEPGAAIAGLLPDSIIEIDNKSITHRPDLWGHHGMAREVAAILALPLTDPVKMDLLPAGDAAIKVRIEDLTLCPRYSALVFDNVKVEPSPLWLQYRLTAIGLNPINNIVDMTNFVMAELSQPMHAFDADLLSGDTIVVRTARPGEAFRGLNGEEYTLDPANVVIADEKGAIALGGVIGGFDSAISGRTTRVVLESANFLASSIRKTSAAIKLRTDASMRFEKAQDPANTLRGLARAIELLRQICPGARLVGGVADHKREIPAPPPIELPLPWLAAKLGRELPSDEVRRILESLAFGVAEASPGVFRVTVPSWRATKDISLPDDLVEEVGRMIGYDTITPTAPLVPAAVPPGNPTRRFHHRVRDIVIDQGFTEAYNYSFISEEAAAAFGFSPESHLRVTNAIASDQTLMRRSLLPGIWRNVVENAKHQESFRLFEIGMEIRPRAEGLPDEIPHLVAALYDRHGDGASGLFEMKRVAECLMPGAVTAPADALSWEHPARAATIEWRGKTVARLFELHPNLVETGRAALLDVDLAVLEALSAGEARYTPIRRYPSSAFDLSVIAPLRAHAGKLQETIAASAGPLLESVEFQRQYSGPPLADGTKSVSFRVTIAAPDHTLSNDEIAAARAGIIDRMRGLGFELRV
ncbi:MAG: phenylalanine--tRNA ligase subunit beta [Acidobacteria bacterium]|nr:phenylalanine--tRNA ligase subunit beta [Acidobacteriota bacterium]